MKEGCDKDIVNKVSNALVKAGSTFTKGLQALYKEAISNESNINAKWIMQSILENACVAEKNNSPLCDDTGIPHVLIEVGPNTVLNGKIIDSIQEGIRQGLRTLPGRSMAVKGDDESRLLQTKGLSIDPGAVEMAPILIRQIEEDVLRVHILLFGGGPAMRGKSYRIFHQHNMSVLLEEIVHRASESVKLLGCTPATLAIGIGRSHFEASSLMVQAIVDASYDSQTDLEQEITDRVNETGIGPLGIGGDTTVLATFLKIGPQRSSGVRIVALRPCCCVEPRIATIEL